MPLFLKSCPRCEGDMETRTDYYGGDGTCLQCGYVKYRYYQLPSTFNLDAVRGRLKPGRKAVELRNYDG